MKMFGFENLKALKGEFTRPVLNRQNTSFNSFGHFSPSGGRAVAIKGGLISSCLQGVTELTELVFRSIDIPSNI